MKEKIPSVQELNELSIRLEKLYALVERALNNYETRQERNTKRPNQTTN